MQPKFEMLTLALESLDHAVVWDGIAHLRAEKCRALLDQLAHLRGAISEQDEREAKAGELCGVSRVDHGCDWPDAVAWELVRLREIASRVVVNPNPSDDAVKESSKRMIDRHRKSLERLGEEAK